MDPDIFISIEQSIRSQLLTIYESANLDERAEIGAEFEGEFDAALKSDDQFHRLTRLVKLTARHPASDRLLKPLLEKKELFADELSQTRLLEGLTGSENRSIAGFAIASLALQSLTANVPVDARPRIEELGKNFASQVCLNGKTGRQLCDEWSERPDVMASKFDALKWPEGPIRCHPEKRGIAPPTLPVDIVTHVGPHFQGWSFEMETDEWAVGRARFFPENCLAFAITRCHGNVADHCRPITYSRTLFRIFSGAMAGRFGVHELQSCTTDLVPEAVAIEFPH